MISKIVEKVFRHQYLSIETELQIRHLFSKDCNLDDLDALIDLQQAINSGYVSKESIAKSGNFSRLFVSHI